MKLIFLGAAFLLYATPLAAQPSASNKPWDNKAQLIPGRMQCEFYDVGGEGVAYHDTDSINNGSGKLNPANGDFFNMFRLKEGVDISYTKDHNIDNTPYNTVQPQMKQLYVGWTQPGEWIRYTVNVQKRGDYTLSVMYTSHDNGIIALDVDGKRVTTDLTLPSTFHAGDTVAWRQWHHWNKIEALAKVRFEKGNHVITLHTVAIGNMNFDYLEFKRVTE